MSATERSRRKKRVVYSEIVAARVLERIASGQSLSKACDGDGFPDKSTVLRWVCHNKEGFRDRYRSAIEAHLFELETELVSLADSALENAKGAPGTGEATAKVHAIKLAVDTRKWILSKLSPKKYGNRVSAEISGPDGGPLRTEGEYRLTPADEAFLKRVQDARQHLSGAGIGGPSGREACEES